MSGADDFRAAIVKAVIDHDDAAGLDTAAYEDVIGSDYYTGLADAVFAALDDSQHRPAIFEAMGLESPPYVLRHRGSDWILVRPKASS